MAQLDKASDYESEDWGFKSLQGYLFTFLFPTRSRGVTAQRRGVLLHAAIAQLGERQTEDLKVPGSIPGGGIHGILAEWLRRLIRNQLGTFPREFESLRCRFNFFFFFIQPAVYHVAAAQPARCNCIRYSWRNG